MSKPVFVRLCGVIRRRQKQYWFDPEQGGHWCLRLPDGYWVHTRFVDTPVVVDGIDEGGQQMQVHRIMPLGVDVQRPVRVRA